MKRAPLRMSFEDCCNQAAAAHRRIERARKKTAERTLLYKGTENSRLTADWMAGLQPVDDELRWSIAKLRARARDLARNNPYAKAYLRLLTDNVIGPTGVKFQAQVRDNSEALNTWINDRIEEAWAKWSENVTIGRQMSLTAFSNQQLRSVARDGEALIRLWRAYEGNEFGFALEAIDPDLLDEMYNRAAGRDGSNEIRMGVEYDSFGRPVAYHIWSEPEYTIGMAPNRVRVRVPADQIMHLFDAERCNQSRGVTWFAPAMYSLRMLDGYEEAELVASRVAASKMGFLVQRDPSAAGAITDKDGSGISMEANPGSLEVLPPGYELQEFAPSHPAQQFGNFVKTQLRKVAGALGVPYNLLANDLESANYSSMRAGRLTAIDTWRTLQQWWVASFQKRIFAEFMNLSVLTGALQVDRRDSEKLLAAKWTPRGWPGVDPQKDVEAAATAIPLGLATRTNVLAEQGLDFEEVLEQLSEEKKLAAQLGVEIVEPQPAANANAAPAKQPAPADAADDGEDQPTMNAQRLRIRNGKVLATGVRPPLIIEDDSEVIR